MIFRRSNNGFTLLEVLAASVILAAAIVVIMQGISMSTTSARISVTTDNARIVAADKLNRYQAGQTLQLPWQGSENFANIDYKWKVDSETLSNDSIICTITWQTAGMERKIRVARNQSTLESER